MAIEATLKNQLEQRFTGRIRFDEPMSAHTSFRVGGPADALVMAADESDLAFLMPFLRDNSLPFLILGGGTNLLVKDGGFPGVVISMASRLSEIFQTAATKITAMAGAKLHKLCRYAIDKGLSGMNFAVGIPGTVGGAIRMNAGTATGDMGGVLESVRVMGPDGGIISLDASRLRFGYRRMALPESMAMDKFVIIDGQFSLAAGSSEALAEEAGRLLKKRKSAQPVHLASAGCFFKNPADGEPAGKLIDMAGLKGLRVNDAEVSTLHGNYFVNRGNASAADILTLMEMVREKILLKFTIYLEPEVQIVGN